MKRAEIRKLTDEQLVHAEIRAERELVMDKFRLVAQKLDNTAKLRSLRKEIARYKTIQREREISAGLPPGTLRTMYQRTFDQQTEEIKDSKPASAKGFLKGLLDKVAGRE